MWYDALFKVIQSFSEVCIAEDITLWEIQSKIDDDIDLVSCYNLIKFVIFQGIFNNFTNIFLCQISLAFFSFGESWLDIG